jgi:hypothetical protein
MISARSKAMRGWEPLLKRFLGTRDTIVMECGTIEKAKTARARYYKVREYYLKDVELHEKYQTVLHERKAVLVGASLSFELHSNEYMVTFLKGITR